MTTYTYLKKGPMHKRPYHLIDVEREFSLCGVVRRGDEGAMVVNHAPKPVDDVFVCVECKAIYQAQELERELE